MKIVLYIITFFWVVSGACFVLYTNEVRSFIKQLLEEIQAKILLSGAVVFGVLLLASASAARNSWFVTLLGLISVIKGGLLLFNPMNSYETLKKWVVSAATDKTYRLFGIILLIVGTAVFSWI